MSVSTRSSTLRSIKNLFSNARSRDYPPEERETAAGKLTLAKVVNENVQTFSSATMEPLLHAAPADPVPFLAIGDFAGIRMAKLNRLEWRAVKMERAIIKLRVGLAKTGSRRVIPITPNLSAWLAALLDIDWRCNELRHSFISYRIAHVESADQEGLEPGNSRSIIFKHYREQLPRRRSGLGLCRRTAGWIVSLFSTGKQGE